MSASDESGAIARMLLDRPPVPVSTPVGVEAPRQRPDLPTDGSMVIDRLCRLSLDDAAQWYLLTFENEPAKAPEPARRVMPCRLLEVMQQHAVQSIHVRFRVSGETFVFRDHAYLMPRKATVVDEGPSPAPKVASPAPPPPPVPASAPATAPASGPASRPAKPGPSADAVFGQLMSEKVGKPVLLETAPPKVAPVPSVAPGATKELAPDRGAMIVDRLVRVLPDPGSGGWWAARFESDNTLGEPPVRILPSQFLQAVQDAHVAKGYLRAPLYRITGELNVYRQQRYVLVRKLLPERDLGRF
jgi:hypothetical protein